MGRTLDDRRMAAWKSFLAAQRALLDRLEAELRAEHDLSLSAYEVLLRLAGAPGHRLRMGELAASVLLTPSGLTRVADRLETEGLIRREACPGDRRVSFLVLTPAGRARLRAASPSHLRGVDEHFGRHLSDADADALTRCLAKVAEHLGRGTDDRACPS